MTMIRRSASRAGVCQADSRLITMRDHAALTNRRTRSFQSPGSPSVAATHNGLSVLLTAPNAPSLIPLVIGDLLHGASSRRGGVYSAVAGKDRGYRSGLLVQPAGSAPRR